MDETIPKQRDWKGELLNCEIAHLRCLLSAFGATKLPWGSFLAAWSRRSGTLCMHPDHLNLGHSITYRCMHMNDTSPLHSWPHEIISLSANQALDCHPARAVSFV
eukprot:4817784-Amphidinium_carterae.1